MTAKLNASPHPFKDRRGRNLCDVCDKYAGSPAHLTDQPVPAATRLPRNLTRDEAVEKAVLYVLQLSDKDVNAFMPDRLIAALEQDGYTVAAIASPSEEPGLDAERLARVLTTLDPDTGQDDWQLVHVSQDDDYTKSRREWAHAIATEYARLAKEPGWGESLAERE